MVTISSTTKVRDVALELPQSTRLFEKFKIDYCCGGDQPLAAACASAGVDVQNMIELIQEIKQTPAAGNGTPDLQKATATELIVHILDKHHVFTKDEMARLEPLADKVVAAHGENHSELLALRDLMRQLFEDLRPHMFKEEQILFPFIITLEKARQENRRAPLPPFATVQNPIRMMLVEHDTAGDLLREMRKLSSDYTLPADACISFKTFYKALEAFEQDLHQHIHLENNLLFPKAVELEAILG
ncbi:MAG TPA: iron-sulfur cluster repair di-iron protein [Pyrinomonadaceae bacterium]|jgi:regulator of cell morphogenesis and NO signaling|nr:iron-sulfur cluster repair di-iron protein [Pyrinomonadaceae bacterium]